MIDRKVWLITGAGRGMGVDFAKAALAAGHAVAGSGRDTARVSQAVGRSEDLLAVKLDVISRADAEAAVRAAVESRCLSNPCPRGPVSRAPAKDGGPLRCATC